MLLVPCVVLLTAGFFYLYGVIMGLLSKKSVRNKVVVITDALSGLGKGNTHTHTLVILGEPFHSIFKLNLVS